MSKSNQRPIQGKIIIGFIRFLSWLPLRAQQAIGGFLGWMLWQINNSAKQTTLANLNYVYPEKTAAEINQIARQSLIETGKTIGELGAIWCWPQQKRLKLIKQVRGFEHLQAALEQQNGVIVLSPHHGCWEIAAHYLTEIFQMSIMYQPPQIGSLDRFIRAARESSGAKLVPTDLTGVVALRRALQQGEAIGVLPDQDPGKNGGVIAPFFNRPANTMLLTAKLAQKSKAQVVFIFAKRLPKGAGYEIHLLPAGENISSKDELSAATALNQGVENCVELAPEQYQWSYKRFKSRSETMPQIYD